MESISNIVSFFVDLVLQAPPLINRDASIVIMLVGIFSLLASVFAESLSKQGTFPKRSAGIIGVCVAGLGALSVTRQPDMWNALLMGHVGLLIVIRFAEGYLVGSALRLWHAAIAAAILVAIVAIFEQMSSDQQVAAKCGWTGMTALYASFQLVRRQSQNKAMATICNSLALFVLFIAIHLYLPHDQLARLMYLWLFPVGVIIGLISRITNKRDRCKIYAS